MILKWAAGIGLKKTKGHGKKIGTSPRMSYFFVAGSNPQLFGGGVAAQDQPILHAACGGESGWRPVPKGTALLAATTSTCVMTILELYIGCHACNAKAHVPKRRRDHGVQR